MANLEGWLYRKKITVTGSTDGAQTDYTIPITVHFGSGTDSGSNVYCSEHCAADFDDIRFTAADGTTLLSHWRESKTDSDNAVYWIKIPSIDASPATLDVYAYYGNAAAPSASSISDAGLFGTDFEIASIASIPSTNAAAKLNLPVPSGYPTQEYVHPSVIDFGVSGWNGYRYWMANTPYCDTNDDYENPCILASNDNSTWVEPSGITNPVVPRPSNTSAYNSDTELIYNDETDELWMYWVITSTTMKAAKSADGIAWTNLDGGALTYGESGTTVMSGDSRTSPSVIKLGTGSWVIYAADSSGTGPWNKIVRYTSTDGRTWANETVCGISDVLQGAGVWHLDVIYDSTLEKYILCTSDSQRGTTFRGGALWLGESTDGLNFSVFSNPVMARKTTGWDSKLLYRPTIHYDSATDVLHLWYSAQDISLDWWTGHSSFDYSDMVATLSAAGAGGLLDFNEHLSNSVKSLDDTTYRSGSKSLKHAAWSLAYTSSNIYDAGWPHFIRYVRPTGSMRLIGWLYDTMANAPDRLNLRINGATVGQYVGVGVYPSTSSTKYCALKTSGSYVATAVDRSNGWHKFEIRYDKSAGASAATIYIDGSLAATLPAADTPNSDAYSIQIQSVRAASGERTMYADDIVAMQFTASEPAITAYATEEYFPDDDTAPNLTDATATATGTTTATASATTDDGNGTLYFLASTSATESAATVKAALSQAVTTDGEQSISLSALDPETTYYVHFVQINGAGLESASVVSTEAFTTDAIAVKGATITLYAGTIPQASMTDIVALWWDATTPSGSPDYSTTTASTDSSGVLTLDLDETTALEIGASGFLLLYKLDATDHRDSLVFAGRVTVSDIA